MKIIKASNGKKTVKISRNEWEQIGIRGGWYKTHKTAQRFKSDADIANEFKGLRVEDVTITPKSYEDQTYRTGYIELFVPEAGESVAGGQEGEWLGTDRWIFYNYDEYKDSNGDARPQIAFDNWYPYMQTQYLKNEILKKLDLPLV